MLLADGINYIVDYYLWTWTCVDRRVDGWFLMQSGKPILFFILLYLATAIYGPKFMKNRECMNLGALLFIYNSCIAVLNLHIFKELAYFSFRNNYNVLCEPVRESTDPEEMRIVKALHLYFISKLLEFLDTIFIILRKKHEQHTFLHVYHHSTMFFFVFIGIRWVPGGSAVMGAIINSFVHVIMYTYYGISVFGPNVTKYLWWKRYLTLIQLIQFCMGLFLGVYGFLVECPFPKWMHYTNFLYMVSYIVLFSRFYQNAYAVKNKSKQKRQVRDENSKLERDKNANNEVRRRKMQNDDH